MIPTVVFLDGYHLGDPLFLSGLARDLADRDAGIVLVHGSGERGERALESLGLLPVALGGVWTVDGGEQQDAVERATRELNKEIIHELNEQGVTAVGAMASGRGLIKRQEEEITVGRSTWVADLVRQGVTVVLAALVDGTEVDAATASGVLADAVQGRAVALTRRSIDKDVASADLDGLVADAEAVRRIADATGSVHLGLRVGLRGDVGSMPVVTGG